MACNILRTNITIWLKGRTNVDIRYLREKYEPDDSTDANITLLLSHNHYTLLTEYFPTERLQAPFPDPSHTNITKKRKTMAEPNKASCTKSINIEKNLCTSHEMTIRQSNSRASKTNSNYEASNDPKKTSTSHPLQGPYTATDNDLYQKWRKLGAPFQQPTLDETNNQRINNNEKIRSFKSKENIHKKEVRPYHGFGY